LGGGVTGKKRPKDAEGVLLKVTEKGRSRFDVKHGRPKQHKIKDTQETTEKKRLKNEAAQRETTYKGNKTKSWAG